MIKFSNQVPSVYPSASRDFQYLGWLIDIVLNSVKHNVDDIYDLPNNKADPKLTELLAMTLGFSVKRNYDQDQLRALVAALPIILKYKGTKTAIDMAGNAILAASGASGDFSSEIVDGELSVVFPVNLVDISLFIDLLEYILPAGMTYHIIRKNQENRNYATELVYNDSKLIANWVPDVDWQKDGQTLPGLSSLFDVSINEPSFANFKENNANALNVGLLDNSIIPMLNESITSVYVPKDDSPVTSSGYTEELNDFGTTVIIDDYSVHELGDSKTVIIEGDNTNEK